MFLKFKDGIVICLAPEGGFVLLQLWQKTDESRVKGEPESKPKRRPHFCSHTLRSGVLITLEGLHSDCQISAGVLKGTNRIVSKEGPFSISSLETLAFFLSFARNLKPCANKPASTLSNLLTVACNAEGGAKRDSGSSGPY